MIKVPRQYNMFILDEKNWKKLKMMIDRKRDMGVKTNLNKEIAQAIKYYMEGHDGRS